MVKVREGEESLPTPTPTVTLTPTTPLSEPIAEPISPLPLAPTASMGVPPSPASSLSASGPVSPASSVNSAGDEPHHAYHRPYHHHSYYNYYGYHPWGRGGSTAGRRHSPHHHHHHHHYHHYQNGSSSGHTSHYFGHHHHQNGSSTGGGGGGGNGGGGSGNGGGSSHHGSSHHYSQNNGRNHYHHQHDGYYNHKGNYQNCYQGYQGGYHGGYSGKGRHKYSSRGGGEDPWTSCLSMGGGGGGVRGRGGGGRYKAISPSRSRGNSPRSRSSQNFSTSVPSLDDSLGSITVEMGGSGGLVGAGATLVGGLEEGLTMASVEEGQHVVHLHINPGTTVNFTTEDGHVQRISGPASVRMVSSNSSPPIPLPVQVPAGHVVQQIVDETGTLRHVILSAQPVPMPMCPYGPNAGQGPPFYGPPPGPPPQGYGSPYQPPAQYSPVMSPPLTQPSPPPAYPLKQERHGHVRQFEKMRGKYYQRPHNQQHKSGSNSLQNTPPLSPKKEPIGCKNGTEEEVVMVEDGDDTRTSLHQLLSQVKLPKVLDITPHKAVLQWAAPDLSGLHDEVSGSEILYDVFLNNGLYMTVAMTKLTLSDLKPATDYKVYLQCVCGDVRGDPSNVTTFHTQPTVPDSPQIPKVIQKTKTSLQFRWCPVKDNGSRVTSYILEICGGNSSDWTEVFKGRGKQFTVNKLLPNTCYRARLAAVNEQGKSEFSAESMACTSGSVPPQPPPPNLEHASVTSLSLSWVKRPEDQYFTLQMEDSLNGYGFRPVYNGHETHYICQGLRRNADYKFRLCSHNDEGASQFSDITCYRTLPDRPKPPTNINVKGRTKATKFTICWSPPTDHGGSPVTSYRVEIDRGNGFECIYSGETLETECTDLNPGTNYRVRVLSMSPGGMSDWSDIAVICTEAVCPGQCQPPRLLGKPKASVLQLQWCAPEYDGGASVTEYHIDMMAPDNDRRQVYCGRDLECTVASLLPGRPYIFLVRGVNRIGPGPWSEPLEVVSGAGPPDAPHAPHLACRSPHSVQLAWEEPINNGAGIDQYVVQVAEVSCLHAESSESSSTCGDPESELTFTNAYTGSATTTEVRNLAPATTYAFRVSCSNSVGTGPWSTHAMVTTPAAPPSPVAYISSTAAATSVTFVWGEPANHGDPVIHYVLEIGDKTVTTPGPETEFTVDDLLPETLYKMRIQAVNSVGAGCFSAYHKVTTRPLPPTPPNIELVRASYNSLRLKWGDGRNVDMLTYSLQMEFLNPHSGTREFYQVYSGTNQNFKLVRLDENTEYRLRICASNEAGVGPYSPVVHLSTTKAPPPPPKAPRVTEGSEGTHLVEWCSVRCPGEDSMVYRLQVAVKDQDYCLVYTGVETSFALTDLEPQTGYYVRVCGVRMCADGETMSGSYSSPTLFNTPKPAPLFTTKTAANPSQEAGMQWHMLSDQQKAVVILVVLSLLCAVAANVFYRLLIPGTER
ncbi:fibronectin type-III domain-containing protein 3a isoform X2 [Macrobrachium rosenbergii]|uniref:fibronectin type-III domain-containing protein 3a isoform X2 n=1 Tax=Macrobrachium rosenbergii TaxID=79674 RepID=UPI0034D6575F